MGFADIHCHLNFDRFNEDRDDVIRKAKISGLEFIIDSGFDHVSNERSLRISQAYEGYVYSTLGFSPNRIGKSDYRYAIDQIIEFSDRIVGIGEVGIDLKKARAGYEKQKEIFLEFVKIAEEIDKPLVIHARKAEEKVFNIIKNRDVTAIFHCYTGSENLMRRIQDAGFYISLSTLVCFAENVEKIAEKVDIDYLMLETDSPFLSPLKGRNEPSNVKYAYEKISQIMDINNDEVSNKLIKNASHVFDIHL